MTGQQILLVNSATGSNVSPSDSATIVSRLSSNDDASSVVTFTDNSAGAEIYLNYADFNTTGITNVVITNVTATIRYIANTIAGSAYIEVPGANGYTSSNTSTSWTTVSAANATKTGSVTWTITDINNLVIHYKFVKSSPTTLITDVTFASLIIDYTYDNIESFIPLVNWFF